MDTVILIGVGLLFVGGLAWSIARAAKKGDGCGCGCGECSSACAWPEQPGRKGEEK